MQGGGQRRIRIKARANALRQRFLAHSQQELLHVHRIHGFHIHLAHGEGEGFAVHSHAQQAARHNDMILRRILAKILQAGQRALA